MTTHRGTNYSHDEDIHLCNVCVKVSHDLNMTTNPKVDQLWDTVTTLYNATKPIAALQNRNRRSLQSRMHNINEAVSKLNECIKQVKCREDQNSDASELDVLFRAKELLFKDPKFRFWFKYDHVWNIMKDIDRFPPKKQRRINYFSSFRVDEETVPDALPKSPTLPPPESSSVAHKARDEKEVGVGGEGGGSSSLEEAKKFKRIKDEDDIPAIVKALMEENEKLQDLIVRRDREQHDFDLQKQHIEIQRKQIELETHKIEHDQWVEENKFLMMNLATISDLRIRGFFANEQEKIMKKREATKTEIQ